MPWIIPRLRHPSRQNCSLSFRPRDFTGSFRPSPPARFPERAFGRGARQAGVSVSPQTSVRVPDSALPAEDILPCAPTAQTHRICRRGGLPAGIRHNFTGVRESVPYSPELRWTALPYPPGTSLGTEP